jgi:hypothetical protein
MKKADAVAHRSVAESNRRRAEEQNQHNRAMVREVVLKSGLQGVQMADLVARLHFNETTIRKHLMRMRADGVVDRSAECGQACRWGAPGIYEAFAERRALRAKKKRGGWQRLKAAEALGAYDWASRPIVRVLVSANDAPPLGKPGPASVWDLAA